MLFRKPVKGDWLRTFDSAIAIQVSQDWSDETFNSNKKYFTLVEVTPVEPPPKPKASYVNIYVDSNERVQLGVGHKTREDADCWATRGRVGCFDASKFIGVYED